MIGKLILQPFGKGSKSEHTAIYFVNDEIKMRLIRKNGNPFHDEYLHSFINKTVFISGEMKTNFFEVEEIKEIEEN